MALQLLLLVLAGAASSRPEGARLSAGDTCYAIVGPKAEGEKTIGATWQSLRRERLDGRPVLRVVVHQHLTGRTFDLRDDLTLDAATLRPIRLDTTRDGRPHAHLEFSDAAVTGFKVGKQGERVSLDQPLTSPVWDGDLYGPTFAALPLSSGATFRVPFYQYDRGLGEFTLRVTGDKVVETPEGLVEAWVVDAGPSDTERLTYLISKADRRELGYTALEGGQRLGGDCTGLR